MLLPLWPQIAAGSPGLLPLLRQMYRYSGRVSNAEALRAFALEGYASAVAEEVPPELSGA